MTTAMKQARGQRWGIVAGVVAGIAAIACGLLWLALRKPDSPVPHNMVTVIDGNAAMAKKQAAIAANDDASADPTINMAAALPIPSHAIDPDPPMPQPKALPEVKTAILQTFPNMKRVDIVCTSKRCEVTGLPRPSTGPDDDALERRMFRDKGLEALLKSLGHTPLGPTEIEEISENETRFRIPIPLIKPAG